MSDILSINTGSSSIKIDVYNSVSGSMPTKKGSVVVEAIGEKESTIILRNGKGEKTNTQNVELDGFSSATNSALALLDDYCSLDSISSVGIRIVHTGPNITEHCILTHEIIEELLVWANLDPNHLPITLTVLEVLQERLPGVTFVGCFDTVFFSTIPLVAQTIAIPHAIDDPGIKRYGFHGLSYAYLLDNFEQNEGRAAAKGRVIMAHLGSGASICAIVDGQPADMTMGFTPASGIPMSTRSGDVDPGIGNYLNERYGLDQSQVNEMLQTHSGLLGISGFTADMYTLLQTRDSNPRSKLAVDVFCYQARKAIASLTSTIGGLDSIIFSGGIGERSSAIRREICTGLEYLGLILDDEANDTHRRLISAPTSRVGVHVIPTDESNKIAAITEKICNKESNK